MNHVVWPPELSQVAQINLAIFTWLKLSSTHPPTPTSLFPSSQNFLLAFSFPSSVFSSVCPVHCCQASSKFTAYVPFIIFLCSGSLCLVSEPSHLPTPNSTITVAGSRHDSLPSTCLFTEHLRWKEPLQSAHMCKITAPPNPLCIENLVRCSPPPPQSPAAFGAQMKVAGSLC